MANGSFAGGNGTPENPYLIEDAQDLNAVRNNLTACYKLIKDIDLSDMTWTPIGNYVNVAVPNLNPCFSGIFDGDGHIIRNLTTASNTYTNVGLFATVGGNGVVRNVKMENVNIPSSGGSPNNHRACIAGMIGGNAIIENCCAENFSIRGRWGISGIVGYIFSNGTVRNCYAINGTFAKMVTNGSYGITSVYSGETGKIINCYSSNTNADYGISSNDGLIVNCFYDSQTSSISNPNVNQAKTTLQMQTTQTFINMGWDDNIWILRNGKYPKLFFESTVKFLLQDENNNLYTIVDDTLSDLSTTEITEELIETYGIDDVLNINKIQPNNMRLLVWTDSTKKSVEVLFKTPSRLLNNLKDFKLLMYSPDTSIINPKLRYSHEPFRPIDKLGDQFEVLAYVKEGENES